MKISAITVACLSLVFLSQGSAQEAATANEVKPVAPAPPQPKPAPQPQAPKPKPAKPKEEAPKKYVVQSGDNPWLIAKNHSVSLDELLKINNIEDPTGLNIGDVLILPKGVASKNSPKKDSPQKAAAPTAGSGDGWEMYTIQSGDNPWTISKKLKVDHQKILSLNEGLNFRDLKIGQQIKVPKKS